MVDTNAVSAFAEGNQSVRSRIAAAQVPYLPVIVVGEYKFGLMAANAIGGWLGLRNWHVTGLCWKSHGKPPPYMLNCGKSSNSRPRPSLERRLDRGADAAAPSATPEH